MAEGSRIEALPILVHRVLRYQHMVVGPEWVFRRKVDPHDKLLFVFDGWADIVGHGELREKMRRLQSGSVALIPGHLPVNYGGSMRLEKMHVYFVLEYAGAQLPLEKLGCSLATSFDVGELRRVLKLLQSRSVLVRTEFHHLIGHALGRVLEPAEDELRLLAAHLERYSNLDVLLSTRPIFRTRVSDLADALGVSESTLSRNFHRDTGRTLKSYIKEQVIRQSKQALTGTLTIKEVASHLGFDDEFYFSKFFKRETGFSPKTYRESLSEELA